MIVEFPIDIGTIIYSIESPCHGNGWKYHFIKSTVVEINKKLDRNNKIIDWGFINSKGNRFSLKSQNKSWGLSEKDLELKLNKLNNKISH